MTARHEIALQDIMPLADYAKVRMTRRKELSARKKNRRVDVGPHITFYFENYDTMWSQVHEMLYIEKGGEEQAKDELAAYNPLIPQGRELVATFMIEIDDPERRKRVLGQLGIGAIVVNDGRQALQALQRLADEPGGLHDKLLMVISDVEMPDMDGYRLTTEIRRDARLAGLFVLLHSSLSGTFNQAMVKRVGADQFIPKLNADELAQGILARLELSQAA